MKAQTKIELARNERQGGYLPKLRFGENVDARTDSMTCISDTLEGTVDSGATTLIARAYENSLFRRAQTLW